jgi:ribosomal protein S18 acetylase RimI-like enzyme
MTNLRLRAGTLEDVTAVLDLWSVAYGEESVRFAEGDSPSAIERLLNTHSAQLLVAAEGEEVIGSLIVTFDGWRGNMYRLAVHPLHQRRGIGANLVSLAHEWLAKHGCSRITALVEGTHPWATGFWESVGYEHDVAMRRYHFKLKQTATL